MGALCGGGKKPEDKKVVEEEQKIEQNDADKSKVVEHQAEDHANAENKNDQEKGNHLQEVPHAEPEVQNEDRSKLIEEYLECVKDIGVEGSIQNMQDNVDIVAVRQDLNFE